MVNNKHNQPSITTHSTVVRKINVISPEIQRSSTKMKRPVKQNKIPNKKISIRRLCTLVCVAVVAVLVLAAIAVVVVITTPKTTLSISSTTTPISTINNTSTVNATTNSITTISITNSTSITSTSSMTTTTTSQTTTITSETTTTYSSTSTSTSTTTTTTESTTPTATSEGPDMTTEITTISSTSSTSSTTSTSTSTTSTRTTSTSSTTTTTPSCTAIPGANLTIKTTAIAWTQFAYNYTAVSLMPTLVFGFSTSTATFIYLDSVSVVDNNASSIQLLNNPGFDNSTLNLTGWTTWCASSCGLGFSGRVLANTSCHSGNCYIDHCRSPDYDYLVQSFPATIGDTYTISFWLELVGAGTLKFYASVQN